MCVSDCMYCCNPVSLDERVHVVEKLDCSVLCQLPGPCWLVSLQFSSTVLALPTHPHSLVHFHFHFTISTIVFNPSLFQLILTPLCLHTIVLCNSDVCRGRGSKTIDNCAFPVTQDMSVCKSSLLHNVADPPQGGGGLWLFCYPTVLLSHAKSAELDIFWFLIWRYTEYKPILHNPLHPSLRVRIFHPPLLSFIVQLYPCKWSHVDIKTKVTSRGLLPSKFHNSQKCISHRLLKHLIFCNCWLVFLQIVQSS